MTATFAQLSPLFTHAGLAAAGAAAVAIPVAIHLLTRLRRQQQPWAAMRFLIEAYRRQKQRLRLEQLLLLFVRCMILLVLGLALSGPLLGGLTRSLGAGGSGRLICLVLDDSLSSRAEPDGRRMRFDDLRRQALRLVDALNSTDRVALFRAARPQRALLAPPTLDHAQARELLTRLEPRYSASDWPGALGAVSAMLAQQQTPSDRVTVVLLSDLAAGSLDLEHAPSAEVVALGRQGRLLVARPMAETPNVQIAALTARRQMVVVPAGRPASAPVELRLRRFASEQPSATTSIELTLLGDDPDKPLATLQREHRWSAGQNAAAIHFEMPIPATLWNDSAAAGNARANAAGVTLTLHARLDLVANSDAIAADNQRAAVLEVRRRLVVGLVDQVSDADPAQPWFLRPRDWLRLALDPGARRGGSDESPGPIDVVDLIAPSLEEATVAPLDAAMVLRPDLLTTRGWAALRALADRGGLVWIFVPNIDSAGAWAGALQEKLGLDWKLGLAPRTASNDASAAWPLTAEGPAPEPLELLSGDWSALLRPIHLSKRIDLTIRGGQDAVWLRAAEADSGAPSAVLACASLGEGHVLLLATALDTTWTNLPTKPLFVPLLHETLRGLLGSAAEAVRLSKVVCGDEPLLGRRWDGAQELVAPGGAAAALRRSDQGLQPPAALEQPGVYTARPGAALKLAVNPDAQAGNTLALDAQVLAHWLSGIGPWSWLDPDRPELALWTDAPRTDLGWPLLWATLALVLLETALARWFSHAG